jgi:7-cyano-7-deazaguanine synthase
MPSGEGISSRKKLATVLFSGGIDSSCCIHILKTEGYSVRGLFVDFGQLSRNTEKRAVRKLASAFSIPTKIVNAKADSELRTGELVGRNAFLIFSALLLGGVRDGLLGIGIHKGSPYYDCSSKFFNQTDLIVRECTGGSVSLIAPLLSWSKDEIFSYSLRTNIPLEHTFSCERAGPRPCGKCASCHERARLGC